MERVWEKGSVQRVGMDAVGRAVLNRAANVPPEAPASSTGVGELERPSDVPTQSDEKIDERSATSNPV